MLDFLCVLLDQDQGLFQSCSPCFCVSITFKIKYPQSELGESLFLALITAVQKPGRLHSFNGIYKNKKKNHQNKPNQSSFFFSLGEIHPKCTNLKVWFEPSRATRNHNVGQPFLFPSIASSITQRKSGEKKMEGANNAWNIDVSNQQRLFKWN